MSKDGLHFLKARATNGDGGIVLPGLRSRASQEVPTAIRGCSLRPKLWPANIRSLLGTPRFHENLSARYWLELLRQDSVKGVNNRETGIAGGWLNRFVDSALDSDVPVAPNDRHADERQEQPKPETTAMEFDSHAARPHNFVIGQVRINTMNVARRST